MVLDLHRLHVFRRQSPAGHQGDGDLVVIEEEGLLLEVSQGRGVHPVPPREDRGVAPGVDAGQGQGAQPRQQTAGEGLLRLHPAHQVRQGLRAHGHRERARPEAVVIEGGAGAAAGAGQQGEGERHLPQGAHAQPDHRLAHRAHLAGAAQERGVGILQHPAGEGGVGGEHLPQFVDLGVGIPRQLEDPQGHAGGRGQLVRGEDLVQGGVVVIGQVALQWQAAWSRGRQRARSVA